MMQVSTIFKTIIGLLFLYVLGVSCGREAKKPLNPNGDSELAILMREMFYDIENVKQQIADGKLLNLSVNHQKILTAHATEPEKAASAEYQAFAETYLQVVNSLEAASPTTRSSLYRNLVDNCMNCHKALCPGPIVRIKKLL